MSCLESIYLHALCKENSYLTHLSELMGEFKEVRWEACINLTPHSEVRYYQMATVYFFLSK